MHPNWPLLDIIFQSHTILCILYGLKLAFVVDLPILCVINITALNPPYLDVNYGYKWELECRMIYFVSLLIGI